VDADPHLAVAMNVLLDQETAPALRARKKSRPTIHVRHLEHLTKQVPFVRFLEGQEPFTADSPTAKNLNLDLFPRSVLECRWGAH